jgi:5-methylcytosine-specific restriction endonuclease McrA
MTEPKKSENKVLVYVLNKDGKPLMPCKPAKARHLLEAKKAYVVRRTPFTIRLKWQCESYTQPLTLAVDPGSGTIGIAVTDEKGQVVYQSETVVSNDIKGKMDQRRAYRRSKRSHTTRYRECRFNNRASSKREDRLSPTVNSKVQAHIREVNSVLSILPITHIVVEEAKFDIHAMSLKKNLKAWEYQKGPMYGFETIKAYIRSRDHYKCLVCGNGPKDLNIHHILEVSKGGTNRPDNLLTLCKTCHDSYHAGKLELKVKKVPSITRHATQIDTIISQLKENFFPSLGIPITYIFGVDTKIQRVKLGIPKSHAGDAVAMSLMGRDTPPIYRVPLLVKKCVSQGDYQQTKGKHSEKQIPTGKILGFRKFDKLKYNGQIYFIKGRRRTGYFELMDIYGVNPKLRPMPKAKELVRLSARSSVLMAYI